MRDLVNFALSENGHYLYANKCIFTNEPYLSSVINMVAWSRQLRPRSKLKAGVTEPVRTILKREMGRETEKKREHTYRVGAQTVVHREADSKKRVSALLIGASLILQNGDNSSGGPCN